MIWKAREALGLGGIIFLFGLIGIVLEGGLYRWLTPSGLLGLAGAFGICYLIALAWTLWHYRGRKWK